MRKPSRKVYLGSVNDEAETWKPQRCPRCGYDLAGAAQSPCAECGLSPGRWSELLHQHETRRTNGGLNHPVVSKLWWGNSIAMLLLVPIWALVDEATLAIPVFFAFVANFTAPSLQGKPTRSNPSFTSVSTVRTRHKLQAGLVMLATAITLPCFVISMIAVAANLGG